MLTEQGRALWRLGAILLVLSASVVFYVESQIAPDWDCSVIDPQEDRLGDVPCFRARLSNANLVTLEWRVSDATTDIYIYDDTAPEYDDLGRRAPRCDSGPEDGCATTLRVNRGGSYRWTLRATGLSGEQLHAAVLISVKPPYPPVFTAGGGFVDALAPGQQAFSWSADPRNPWPQDNANRAWVEVSHPNTLYWDISRYPRSGPLARLTVPTEALSDPGDVIYKIRDCRLPEGSTTKLCSPPAIIAYKVGYDHFLGLNHRHVPAGEDLAVTFTTRSGNMTLLSSDTLIPKKDSMPVVAITEPVFTVSGALLTPGSHRIALNSCLADTGTCSNRLPVEPAAIDGIAWHRPPGYYEEGELIATVVPEDDSDRQEIHMPVSGQLVFVDERISYPVEAGTPLAFVITASADELHIMVDAPVAWSVGRDYTQDFEPAIAHDMIGPGTALDIAFDHRGGIWLINEFSNSVEHVTSTGHVRSLNLPLARDPGSEPLPNHAATPFTTRLTPEVSGPTSTSTLAERATRIDSLMWFTQGGGLLSAVEPRQSNHSRIISYNPFVRNSARTRYNDKFCVYNVPTDDSQGFGNNQVIGLTAAMGRIWLAESRGLLSNTPSYLSSFVPGKALCDNLLNFGDASAVANQPLQYCAEGRTPEQDACMEHTALVAMDSNIKIAHLETDPVDGSVWFSDATGKCLGNIDTNREPMIQVHEFRDKHEEHFTGQIGLGGFPWHLQVDGDAVYISEYSTRHILRFDKASKTFDEIAVPFQGLEMRLHSMVIDSMRQRLWFTLVNEHPVPTPGSYSTIGYIDIASWRERIERPERNTRVRGVTYRGLRELPPSRLHPGASQGFRGIDIDPKTGRIALATMWREQVTVLTPLPGFWP